MSGPHPRSQAGRIPSMLRQFLDSESSAGIVLMAAAVVALVWSNSPWGQGYHDFWHAKLSVGEVKRIAAIRPIDRCIQSGVGGGGRGPPDEVSILHKLGLNWSEG